MSRGKGTIAHISLGKTAPGQGTGRMNHECDTALKDLEKEGVFQPQTDKNGPYSIELDIQNNRLVFQIKNMLEEELPLLVLSLSPYRRIIRDYFFMIESYEKARLEGNRSKLETIDMARRGIHNEAADLMQERLKDKIEMDFETARRIFTLICVLHLGQPQFRV